MMDLGAFCLGCSPLPIALLEVAVHGAPACTMSQ